MCSHLQLLLNSFNPKEPKWHLNRVPGINHERAVFFPVMRAQSRCRSKSHKGHQRVKMLHPENHHYSHFSAACTACCSEHLLRFLWRLQEKKLHLCNCAMFDYIESLCGILMAFEQTKNARVGAKMRENLRWISAPQLLLTRPPRARFRCLTLNSSL